MFKQKLTHRSPGQLYSEELRIPTQQILFGHKKEWITDLSYNMDEP